jgi:hypothetical protein
MNSFKISKTNIPTRLKLSCAVCEWRVAQEKQEISGFDRRDR